MQYKYIKYQPGKVTRIILNRPEYRNALSYEVFEEVHDALFLADADEKAGAIVLSGEGPSFSSGHDVGTPEHLADCKQRGLIGKPEAGYTGETYLGEHLLPQYYDIEKYFKYDMKILWRRIRKPTIAMVQGWAVFGGYMLASSMDLVFASEDALFIAPTGQYNATPWDFGPRKAKEMCFEHRAATAREAYECGFVSRVFPLDKLESETLAFAERVADNYFFAPMFIQETKRSIDHMMDAMGFTTELESGWRSYALLSKLTSELQGSFLGVGGKGTARAAQAFENLQLRQETQG